MKKRAKPKRLAKVTRPAPPAAPGLGQRSVALDYYSNPTARLGFGTPSLNEATEYQMVRLSNNYWLMLTLYRNSWICRRVIDGPAEDMCRTWAKLNCDVEPDEIQSFDRTIARTFTVQRICQTIKWARLYGGAGALICIKGHEKKLHTPLRLQDINPGTYLGLIPFDRWSGIQPGIDIEDDITKPAEWGLPASYRVQPPDVSGGSFEVHASRILRFTGPEVPSPELQAQCYWGISELELIFEELRKRDNASFSILALLFRANIIGTRDDNLASMLSGLGSTQAAAKMFAQRMQAQNELMSNQSMVIVGKDGEMFSTQYTFAGIGEVYAQFQMDIAGAAHYPVTRLFGRTVTGLGQTNDADERYYEEHIAQTQDFNVRPQLNKLYPIICMSEWGEVPEDLDFSFPSIRVLTEEEKAEMTDKASAPIIAAYNAGLIWKRTAVKELHQLADTTGIFSNITEDEIAQAEEEPAASEMDLMEAGAAAGPGGGPLVSPEKEKKKLAGGAEA